MAHDFPNCQVIGIDILPPSEHEGWSLARTGAWSAGQTRNVCFQKQDILQSTLSFDDGSFDFVYQRDVATVLPFNIWPKLLLEFFRITKPGGKIELVEYGNFFYNSCHIFPPAVLTTYAYDRSTLQKSRTGTEPS